MQLLTILFLTLISFLFRQKEENKYQIIFDRIEYIFNLKTVIDHSIWKDFDNKKFDVPLIYYTETSSFVANPTDKFIVTFRPIMVFENKNLKIYKTPERIDNTIFHMATSISLGDSTNDYNYNSPFMNCSSFEITSRTIPDISSTEQWATMIIHEYFHGFQFRHKSHLNFTTKELTIPSDSLRKIYKTNEWFKEKIDKENELLLKAINSKSKIEITGLINSFFKLRANRRLETKKKLNFDIEKYESAYEAIEGTARYVEYSLYDKFSTMQANYKLAKTDTSFHSYDYFKNYRIEKDQWLYLTDKTSYVYAIGFNMARLLDKLKIEYKSRLFNEGGLSLEQILRTEQKRITSSPIQ